MRLPTKRQIEIYKLIHPDFSNLSVEDAADVLGISFSSAYRRIKRIRSKYPEAFRFEKELKGYHNVNNIYAGYKRIAKTKGRKFSITINDLIEIIRVDCFFCGYRPIMRIVSPEILELVEAKEKTVFVCKTEMYTYLDKNKDLHKIAYNPDTGDIFPYNHIWRYDVTKSYTYDNCIPICSFCAMKRRKI